MPCMSYKARFVDPVLAGTKVHTVRIGGRDYKPGDTIYMQTGSRFKPRRFAERTVLRVRPITISDVTVMVWHENLSGFIVPVLDKFAHADGFADWADLKAFFMAMHGFKTGFGFKEYKVQGRLIQWAPAEWERR